MEKRPHDSTALRVGQVHQGVEVRQEGVSGLQDTFGDIHECIIPGHRVLPLQEEERSYRAHHRGAGGLEAALLQMKITYS